MNSGRAPRRESRGRGGRLKTYSSAVRPQEGSEQVPIPSLLACAARASIHLDPHGLAHLGRRLGRRIRRAAARCII